MYKFTTLGTCTRLFKETKSDSFIGFGFIAKQRKKVG